MQPEEFRRHAHALADWMADYMADVERHPVRSHVAPGDVLGRLPDAAPETGEPMETIFRDFEDVVMPGMTHWQHPSYFAYFPANSSPPSVLAEMLTATLAAQCMIWQTSPAATELETRMMEWLRDLLGLPGDWAGVIQDGASTATLCAILSARERATGYRANAEGVGAGLTVYGSAEAHSSVDKAVRVAGIGSDNLRKVAVDDAFAMDPAALDAAIAADVAAGRRPICVVATLGTTGVGAFDPLAPIGEVCRRHGVWLHVDAAWAGGALVLAEERWMIDGIAGVDSFIVNPHKWLFTNFDCSAYFVRDAQALTRTFEILPEYLKTGVAGQVTDYRDWGIPLGRRFRALKLWFVLRWFGAQGLRERVAGHIEMARALAGEIEAAADFELMAPTRLSLLCLRYRPPGVDDPARLDALNQTLLDALNDSGALYASHTRVRGAFTIRLCVGQTNTERRHLDAAWNLILETARGLDVS